MVIFVVGVWSARSFPMLCGVMVKVFCRLLLNPVALGSETIIPCVMVTLGAGVLFTPVVSKALFLTSIKLLELRAFTVTTVACEVEGLVVSRVPIINGWERLRSNVCAALVKKAFVFDKLELWFVFVNSTVAEVEFMRLFERKSSIADMSRVLSTEGVLDEDAVFLNAFRRFCCCDWVTLIVKGSTMFISEETLRFEVSIR